MVAVGATAHDERRRAPSIIKQTRTGDERMHGNVCRSVRAIRFAVHLMLFSVVVFLVAGLFSPEPEGTPNPWLIAGRATLGALLVFVTSYVIIGPRLVRARDSRQLTAKDLLLIAGAFAVVLLYVGRT